MQLRLLLMLSVLVVGCGARPPASEIKVEGTAPLPTAATSRESSPADSDTGFPRADGPRTFAFPEDHGAHPEYKTEWWYYTGTLRTMAGREFGLQITFFRRALSSTERVREASFATNQIYMAHFAVSDLSAGKFHHAERVARGAAGLAGASTEAHAVELLGWSVQPTPEGFAFALDAATEGFAFRGTAREVGAPVLHGESPGWSLKSGPDQASYYYSLPRIPTSGVLTIDGVEHAVSGELWMDHEFGSNQLGVEQAGWDWFALQFDSGDSLMAFQLRAIDPATPPSTAGTWIPAAGDPIFLPQGALEFLPGDTWTSPTSEATYPIAWQLRVPQVGLDIAVRAKMPAQELQTGSSTGITYWEGAIRATGSHPGEGYLEMTGYVENVGGRF